MSSVSGASSGWPHLEATNSTEQSTAGWLIDPATVPNGFYLCSFAADDTTPTAGAGSTVLIADSVPADAEDGHIVFEKVSNAGGGSVAAGLFVPPGYGLYCWGTGVVFGVSWRVL